MLFLNSCHISLKFKKDWKWKYIKNTLKLKVKMILPTSVAIHFILLSWQSYFSLAVCTLFRIAIFHCAHSTSIGAPKKILKMLILKQVGITCKCCNPFYKFLLAISFYPGCLYIVQLLKLTIKIFYPSKNMLISFWIFFRLVSLLVKSLDYLKGFHFGCLKNEYMYMTE